MILRRDRGWITATTSLTAASSLQTTVLQTAASILQETMLQAAAPRIRSTVLQTPASSLQKTNIAIAATHSLAPPPRMLASLEAHAYEDEEEEAYLQEEPSHKPGEEEVERDQED